MSDPWIAVEIPVIELGKKPELGEVWDVLGKFRVVEVTDVIGARKAVTVRLEIDKMEKAT